MMNKPSITVEQASALKQPTKDFLCSIEDNIYDIQFVYFRIRDVPTNQTLFQIRKPETQVGKKSTNPTRYVQYHFGPMFFQLGTVGTTLEFKIGSKPVKKFLMIERHYFKGELIKSFEFQVPFCMPNSQNSMEAVYEFPKFSKEKEQQMTKCPFETISDSFYFVQGKLVMHNKAAYSFTPFDAQV